MDLLSEAEALAHRLDRDTVHLVDGLRAVERGEGPAAQLAVGCETGGGEVVEGVLAAGDAEIGGALRAQLDLGVEVGLGNPVDVGLRTGCGGLAHDGDVIPLHPPNQGE